MKQLARVSGRNNHNIYSYSTNVGIRYAVRISSAKKAVIESGILMVEEARLIRDKIIIDIKRKQFDLGSVRIKPSLTFKEIMERLSQLNPAHVQFVTRRVFSMKKRKYITKQYFSYASWKKGSEYLIDHLVAFFGNMTLEQIDYQTITQYIVHRREEPIMHSNTVTTCDTSIKKELRIAKKIVDRAFIAGMTSDNPFAKILNMRIIEWLRQPKRRPAAQTYLPMEIRERIVAAAKKYKYGKGGPQIYIPIIAETGCRPSDLLQVYWMHDIPGKYSYIDLAKRQIILMFGDHKSKAAKFQNRPRIVYLSENLCEYLRQFERKGQRLCPLNYTVSQVKTFRRLCHSIGIKGISIYSLRYSAACDFCNSARDRLSEQAIADHLGHTVGVLRSIYSEPSNVMADIIACNTNVNKYL